MTMLTPQVLHQTINGAFAAAETASRAWWLDGIRACDVRWGDLVDAARGWLPRGLVLARIWHETRGNPRVVSKDPLLREVGLLQLSKPTREQYAHLLADPTDPLSNLSVGCLVWRRWADSFRRWASDKRLLTDAQGGAIDWLVTAIGPGAVRDIATACESARYADWLEWIRSPAGAAELYRLHSAGLLGRAKFHVTVKRIATAGHAVAAAVEYKGGSPMSLGWVALLSFLLSLVALVAFWVMPSTVPGGAA